MFSVDRLTAALRRLPSGSAFSGATAGWLYGLDLDPFSPIEVTVPTGSKVTRRAGMRVHRAALVQLSLARGLPVTTRVVTVVDLVRRRPLVDAMSILDMAMHRRLVNANDLDRWAALNAAQRGVAVVRRALQLAEPATESPMETRLRLLLVLAGLPKPQVQPTLRDELGTFLARPDLYYATHRLAIEYDGLTHKDSIVADNRRQNRLLEAGYRVLRFTATDIYGTPAATVSLVRRALARPVSVHSKE